MMLFQVFKIKKNVPKQSERKSIKKKKKKKKICE